MSSFNIANVLAISKWPRLEFIILAFCKLLKFKNNKVVTSLLASLWQKWNLNLELLISGFLQNATGHSVLMCLSHSFLFYLCLKCVLGIGVLLNPSLMHVPFISIDFNTMDSKSIWLHKGKKIK
jgi:hypothetical protein